MSDPSSSSSSSVAVHVKLFIDPKQLDAFYEAVRPTFEHVVQEPKNTYFEMYTAATDPGTIQIVEHWNADVKWLVEVQLKKDYYEKYFEITKPMYVKPQEVEFFTRLPKNEWVSVRKEEYPGRE